MLLRHPVKMVVPRGQLFHTGKFRPGSVHRLKLGAGTDVRMTALRYGNQHQNSRDPHFRPSCDEVIASLYKIENQFDVVLDTQSPGHMRAPLEHPGERMTGRGSGTELDAASIRPRPRPHWRSSASVPTQARSLRPPDISSVKVSGPALPTRSSSSSVRIPTSSSSTSGRPEQRRSTLRSARGGRSARCP